jgi:hypothetical protein
MPWTYHGTDPDIPPGPYEADSIKDLADLLDPMFQGWAREEFLNIDGLQAWHVRTRAREIRAEFIDNLMEQP